MTKLQTIFIAFFGILNLLLGLKGFVQCSRKANTYGITWGLFPLGIFVWGDAVIFGPFWAGASIVSLLLKDWLLFLLVFSVFWVVRSLGETIYWFNQQFSGTHRYPPEQLIGHKIFKGKLIEEYDAIWFVNQIAMQCLTVISLITTIYITYLWLNNIF